MTSSKLKELLKVLSQNIINMNSGMKLLTSELWGNTFKPLHQSAFLFLCVGRGGVGWVELRKLAYVQTSVDTRQRDVVFKVKGHRKLPSELNFPACGGGFGDRGSLVRSCQLRQRMCLRSGIFYCYYFTYYY